MRRWLLAFVMLGGMIALVPVMDAGALGLKVAPLEYRTTLKKGERQAGFVDISNPSSQVVAVKTSVQAFRQVDDSGGIQFYSDERISSGIRLDLSEFELGPRQAVRMAFTVEGEALPHGDVYAAIFFETNPTQPRNGVGQLVRVGTLLSIVNATPGSRSAEVTGIDIPGVQFSDTVKGRYTIKNTGPGTSGFYPTVELTAWPGGASKKTTSSLVFGGRERTNEFSHWTGYGIHRLEISYGQSKKTHWVVTVAPWMLILGLVIGLIVLMEVFLLRRRRKSSGRSKPETTTPTP